MMPRFSTEETLTIVSDIPKDFIRHNRIDEADLERFSNFVTRIMATDPTLLESYFPKAVEPQKTF